MLEKLIEILTALVVAINNNTAALKSAPVAPSEEPKKTRTPKVTATETPPAAAATVMTPAPVYPTVVDVRDAAKALLDATGNQDNGLFAKINARLGLKKISDAPEDKRAEVIAEIKGAMPKKEVAPSAQEQI